MNPNIQLALHYLEDEEGLIEFPRDIERRRKLWPENVFSHPAKFNCNLVEIVSELLCQEGQTVLDPMSGTGTSMLAATRGMRVVLVEVEEKYHQMQQAVVSKLEIGYPQIAERIFLINADCRKALPIPADMILFSPPYGDMLKRKKVSGIAAEEGNEFAELPDYSTSPYNIGKYNQFMFLQVMEKVYKQLLESAPLMVNVLKDRVQGKKRVDFVGQNIKLMENVGWKLYDHVHLKAPGSRFIHIHVAEGGDWVKDESMLIMRRR